MVKNATKQFHDASNAILLSATAALALYLLRYAATGSAQFSFMAWNLLLSLGALSCSVLFIMLWKGGWNSKTVIAALVWLLLLPNTFYMLTDFVHVSNSGDITILFDIVLIGFFAMNGFMHGMLSLLMVHKKLLPIYKQRRMLPVVGAIILASSYAVDMGRYLRWNSWDALLHPSAVLFDVSNTFFNPFSNDRSLVVTAVFFVTISCLYTIVWQLSKVQWGAHGTDTK